MSSPVSFATTNAGRFFEALRSENGNGATTTSPFTNAPMPRPLQAGPNRVEALPRTPAWSRAHRFQKRTFRVPADKTRSHSRPQVFRAAVFVCVDRFRRL